MRSEYDASVPMRLLGTAVVCAASAVGVHICLRLAIEMGLGDSLWMFLRSQVAEQAIISALMVVPAFALPLVGVRLLPTYKYFCALGPLAVGIFFVLTCRGASPGTWVTYGLLGEAGSILGGSWRARSPWGGQAQEKR